MHKNNPPAVYNDYDFAQAKSEYRVFCEAGDHDLPVFALPWYLDAACASSEDWQVVLYKEDGQIRAAFPFAYTKGKYGLWRIHNPWQAARLGIWIDYREKSKRPGSRETYESAVVADIISKLPYYDEFCAAFDARFQNWQPFYRMGFQQTSHYSYVLDPPENLLAQLSYNMRREVRLLQKDYTVDGHISLEEYWDFFEKSYRQRGRTPSYGKEPFFRLCEAALRQRACRLIGCRDQSGSLFSIAGVFMDSRRMYNMFNTFDTSTKFSTLPLVTLYAIESARQMGLLFDFEGSMIPGVANYNLKFNAVKEPYFVITDYSDKYRLLNGLRESARAAKRLTSAKIHSQGKDMSKCTNQKTPPRIVDNDYDFAQSKAEYRAFCAAGDHDLPVFALPWYLDAVCSPDEEWRVILYKENDQIRAAFPFAYMKGKYGLWHIRNPWMAPRLGVWIDYRGKTEKTGGRESYENGIVADIVSKLPPCDFFQIAFDARFQNWQQFYRLGFRQTSYYSYLLRETSNIAAGLSVNTRRKVRLLSADYQAGTEISFEEYWAFFEKSYAQRKRTPSYSKERFFALYDAARRHGAEELVACRDRSGQIFSTACLFLDSRRVYNMCNTYDTTTKLSTQPVTTLRSIALAEERGLEFDFEGSMIPGVAEYDSTFNPVKEPYFVITHYSDRYRLLNGLRESARALGQMVHRKGV